VALPVGLGLVVGVGLWWNSRSSVVEAPPPERRCGVALGLFASDPAYDYGPLLDEVVDHGATDVLLSVPWVQASVHSDHLAPQDGQSPSNITLERTLEQARARGLAVSLMPVVRLDARAPGVWRGALDPADRDAWFSAYAELMHDHAILAQRHGAVRLVLGSELSSLEPEVDRWTALVSRVRAHFDGRLTWSANWDRFDHLPFWDHLDEVGVSAWFEVGDHPAAGWDAPIARMRAVSEHTGKPVVLTEVGYPARATAAHRPWDHSGPATPHVRIQAQLFEVFFERFRSVAEVHAVFVWNWFGHGGHADAGYSPRGRPAAQVLKRAYTQWCPQG